MFYNIGSERYKVILTTENGKWLISFDNPSAPIFSIDENMRNYEKIETPKEYIENIEFEELNLSKAEERRYAMIEPLLSDDIYIYDKSSRNELAKKCAESFGTTKKRVLRLYFQYMAKRTLIKRKNSTVSNNDKYKEFDWAIKKYYFSAKRISIKTTYDMLLLEKYMNEDGLLVDNAPTWNSFRHYFYNKNYNRSTQKDISREGLTNYQRNKRPLFGQADSWNKCVGYYEMDATEADIYLVSRFDERVVVGRPNVYMAVDRLTQTIAGVYIGFRADESAVIACLANAASDKVEYCKKYGIEITKDQWPCTGLPSGIITDQGNEFMGSQVESLCYKYDIELEYLPPFRPDEKSEVEKSFDIVQEKYKPFLRGKGVIEMDAQERWAADYRSQSAINIDDFTKILIHCILYVNGRLIENKIPASDVVKANVPIIPNRLWKFFDTQGKNTTIPISEHDIYLLSLDRKTARINRKGIYYNGFWYKNKDITKIMMEIKGNQVAILYDVDNISAIYLILKKEYIKFELPDYYSEYADLNTEEYDKIKKKLLKQKQQIEKEQTEARVNLIKNIKSIVKGKEIQSKGKQIGDEIKENQKVERDHYL